MAYDRMWLKHRKTGRQILLAKSSNGYDWKTRETLVPMQGDEPISLAQALDGMLERVRDDVGDGEIFEDFVIEFESD